MVQQIYVNLSVKDLPRSRTFFEQLGFGFDQKFSNDKGACLILGENIYAMLLDQDFFKSFTTKRVVDATKEVEALVCVSVATRAEVDLLVKKATSSGAQSLRDVQDHGFMYSHGFEDLDGHTWEIVSYEPKK